VPGYKGKSSSVRFPRPLMGDMELQENLWAHIFLVDIGLHNVSWFGAWARCLNQLFYCDFKAGCVVLRSLGLLSTEDCVSAAACLLHGDKSQGTQWTIWWVLRG